MFNKAMIIGRLGRDPELVYTTTGMPICRFSVATDESYKDKDGNKIEKAEWHRIVTFQKQAENCSMYLGKGSLVFVEGSLQTQKWEKDGQTHYTTEIKAQRVLFLDRKGENQNQNKPQQAYDDDPDIASIPETSGWDDVPFS